MNSQKMMEEIDRLTRLCEAKDAEIAILRNEANTANRLVRDDYVELKQLRNLLSEAQAEVAVQAEFIERISKQKPEEPDHWNSCGQCERNENEAEELLSATSETVAAWRAKEFGECTRSHPHELMSPMCKLRTEIARLTNHLATAQAETEPLRREVAMLRSHIEHMLFIAGEKLFPLGSATRRVLADAQATALAYEREVENRGAVKALESLLEQAVEVDTPDGIELHVSKVVIYANIVKLRASKGEPNTTISRQIADAKAEVATWPDSVKRATEINEQLTREK